MNEMNDYPKNLVNRTINEYKHEDENKSQTCSINNNEFQIQYKYFEFPYIANLSEKIKNIICKDISR